MFDDSQDVGRREVSGGEKDVGKEVDACMVTVEAFGNGVDNEVAGVVFH